MLHMLPVAAICVPCMVCIQADDTLQHGPRSQPDAWHKACFVSYASFVLSMLLCRTCYRTLVVSEDAVLRFLYEKVEEMKTAAYREYRADWLQKFRTHLIAAEKVHLRVRISMMTVAAHSRAWLSGSWLWHSS